MVAAPAYADVVVPNEEVCAGAEAGKACSTPEVTEGTCQTGECCHLDYSSGAPPKQVCEPCLTCQPAEAEAEAAPTKTASATEAPAPEAPEAKSSNCQTAGASMSWTALLGVGLLVQLRRRRRA